MFRPIGTPMFQILLVHSKYHYYSYSNEYLFMEISALQKNAQNMWYRQF